jgi:hypothetical protein
VEWQHHQNQPLVRFGLAIGWNKNSSKNLCSYAIFIVFFKFLIEIVVGDGINEFLLKI